MLNNPNAYGREQMAVCENKIRQALAANSPSERVDRLTQSYERLDSSLHHAFLMVLIAHVSMKPVDNHLSDRMAPSPADPMQDWLRYCLEQGLSTLEEACGPYEPLSSPQTWVQRLCGCGQLPGLQTGFLRWLHGGLEGSQGRPVSQGFHRSTGLKPDPRRKTTARSLFVHRNVPLVFSIIGLAIIMVKLAAGKVKAASRHASETSKAGEKA